MDKAHVLRYAGVAARGRVFSLFYRNKHELDRNGSNKKTDFFRFDEDALQSAIAPEPVQHEPIDEYYLKHCTPTERTVLKLHFEDGLSDPEIGKRMGVSRQAVNDTRRRGMRRVRWVLQA
jgi:DNA-directed RNA polymerase specialized sigma24 family protein